MRFSKIAFSLVMFIVVVAGANAQNSEVRNDSAFKPSGQLWGYVFGDYFYKAHSDALVRGGGNQYTNIESGRNAFQLRRVYLGYNYNIAPKFSAELLLAAEDNQSTNTGVQTGDLLSNNKLSFYIKLANLRWKSIWKGTDLVVGQVGTPAFILVTDPIWQYRAIERTIADIRRTPAFDLGAALQGQFDPGSGKYGYNVMVGNGTGARPENDKFKWFYADVWARLLDKKLVFDLYADYQRITWTPSLHHSRNMVKAFAAYTTPNITVGVEAFFNHGKNDVIGVKVATEDTLNANSTGISTYVHGNIIKDKLRFFARVDKFNPDTKYNGNTYTTYKGLSPNYEPNNSETFVTGGLDFTPVKNVHFMPNVWYNHYKSQRSLNGGNANNDHDLVYRITFFYVYGR